MATTESQRLSRWPEGLENLRAITISHRSHGFDALSRVSPNAVSAKTIHGSLADRGTEAVFLGTCNRRELYWLSRTEFDGSMATSTLAAAIGDADVVERSRVLVGPAVAEHLFRVCAGLESAVLGEAEILGQVRAALDASPAAGPFLSGIIRAALRAGGAARAETAIGEGALSVVSTAVQWLSRRMPLAEKRVLVLGAGNTGRKVVRHLRALGVTNLVIANRTRGRAEELAAGVNAVAIDLGGLPSELQRVDVIVSAVSASEWLITRDQLEARESSRPLTLVDLSMPPSVEPGDVGGVLRVDLAVLDRKAEASRAKRQEEIPRVEAVIARELEYLSRWARREAARPALAARRGEIDLLRQREVLRAQVELKASADPGEVLDRFSRRLLNRVLSLEQTVHEESQA